MDGLFYMPCHSFTFFFYDPKLVLRMMLMGRSDSIVNGIRDTDTEERNWVSGFADRDCGNVNFQFW